MIVTTSEFRLKCVQLLNRVRTTGERIQVTSDGKVIAELVPPTDSPRKPAKAGFAKASMKIVGDIIEPLDETWDALE